MHRGDPFKSCNQFDVASHSANQARRSLIDSKMSAMTPLRCLAFLAPTTSGIGILVVLTRAPVYFLWRRCIG
ncbi:MAG: hypothetical protein DMF30_10555 [Verrucomicrobia bacterium]|nr:MAG: hypothetical protein DMF30_10555 [Verrucomicrobiota bacterium]